MRGRRPPSWEDGGDYKELGPAPRRSTNERRSQDGEQTGIGDGRGGSRTEEIEMGETTRARAINEQEGSRDGSRGGKAARETLGGLLRVKTVNRASEADRPLKPQGEKKTRKKA
ncbi:hypothetical protein Tco_0367217 [Tanacetum coccineum]